MLPLAKESKVCLSFNFDPLVKNTSTIAEFFFEWLTKEDFSVSFETTQQKVCRLSGNLMASIVQWQDRHLSHHII